MSTNYANLPICEHCGNRHLPLAPMVDVAIQRQREIAALNRMYNAKPVYLPVRPRNVLLTIALSLFAVVAALATILWRGL